MPHTSLHTHGCRVSDEWTLRGMRTAILENRAAAGSCAARPRRRDRRVSLQAARSRPACALGRAAQSRARPALGRRDRRHFSGLLRRRLARDSAQWRPAGHAPRRRVRPARRSVPGAMGIRGCRRQPRAGSAALHRARAPDTAAARAYHDAGARTRHAFARRAAAQRGRRAARRDVGPPHRLRPAVSGPGRDDHHVGTAGRGGRRYGGLHTTPPANKPARYVATARSRGWRAAQSFGRAAARGRERARDGVSERVRWRGVVRYREILRRRWAWL